MHRPNSAMTDASDFPPLDYTTPSHPPQQVSEITSAPSTSTSQHIRFGNLPKVDHSTGSIIYPLSLRSPAHGAIAQRRVDSSDARRELHIARCFQYQRKHFPKEHVPLFHHVSWKEDVHPGRRVPCPDEEGYEDRNSSPGTCDLVSAETEKGESDQRVEREDPELQSRIEVCTPSTQSASSSSRSRAGCAVPLICCSMQ